MNVDDLACRELVERITDLLDGRLSAAEESAVRGAPRGLPGVRRRDRPVPADDRGARAPLRGRCPAARPGGRGRAGRGVPPPTRLTVTSSDRWRLAAPVAELVGAATVIFVLVTARVVAWHPESPVAERITTPAGRIAFVAIVTAGAIVAVARSPLGRLSGAHLNPAVTLGFGLQGMVAPFELIAYPIAQCSGAVLGALGRPGRVGTVGRPPARRARGDPTRCRLERPRRDRDRGARHRGAAADRLRRAEPSLDAPVGVVGRARRRWRWPCTSSPVAAGPV